MAGQSSSQAASPFQWWKPALFFLVVIVGLWYVKWQPYYGKAFTAAETHSIGKSILAQADANPLMAAWDYAGEKMGLGKAGWFTSLPSGKRRCSACCSGH